MTRIICFVVQLIAGHIAASFRRFNGRNKGGGEDYGYGTNVS